MMFAVSLPSVISFYSLFQNI